MERKHFLRNGAGLIGLVGLAPLLQDCKKQHEATSTSSDCTVTPQETAGPYPYDLSADSAIYRTDITEGKTGVPLSLTLTVVNTNNDCAAIKDARVDIWHCDKDGYYSEYSVSGYLGTEDNTGKTFLRGIQSTDASGQVKFTTIYPGWYTGRVTHIHVEVYVNSVLKSTTQLAFPESITTAVYNSTLYAAHGQNTITNSTDQVFSDSYTSELLTITGDTTNGYTATFQLGVAL
ncbi:intradiol ring-cleavage dioxygenase [Dinghuibacter silviterrae]|uniref:Dioxygenase-like protein n=1 Tax=Dinghuibacter silviterrae TaxID=1539049 RepID=A0A4R8DWJ2_9BACT|nr:intradiol ring-cleavage dioxygenase [Dinghuibacter silviterrae]TDX01581.1 dioxygenase-like protein [Dinghuibacter silviterrae]